MIPTLAGNVLREGVLTSILVEGLEVVLLAHLLLERLGAELWQRRKQAGYSLSEVADAIRINQEVLKTIETGQVDYGPGQTFIRGFMRSYARFLDMDPQVFQERLNGAEREAIGQFPPNHDVCPDDCCFSGRPS